MTQITIETTLPLPYSRKNPNSFVDHELTVTAHVRELSEKELHTTLVSVNGLPCWLTLATLSNKDRESLTLDIEAEYEARELRRKEVARELDQILGVLRRALEGGCQLEGKLADYERLGALQFACDHAIDRLTVLQRGVA